GSIVGVVGLRGLDAAAAEIAGGLKGKLGAGVLIVEDRALALSDAPYQEITKRLDVFRQQFDTTTSELNAVAALSQGAPSAEVVRTEFGPALAAVPAAGQAVVSTVGLAADLVGMFKSNYTISGRDLNLEFTALAAAVAQNLVGKAIVIIDGLFDLDESPTLA